MNIQYYKPNDPYDKENTTYLNIIGTDIIGGYINKNGWCVNIRLDLGNNFLKDNRGRIKTKAAWGETEFIGKAGDDARSDIEYVINAIGEYLIKIGNAAIL